MKNPLQMQQILKQVQQFQEQLQKQLDELVVEATAGGGMVTVKMNGQKQLHEVRIDPEVFASQDVEMLQDLITAAVNGAGHKVDDAMQSTMGGMLSGMGLPPGMF